MRARVALTGIGLLLLGGGCSLVQTATRVVSNRVAQTVSDHEERKRNAEWAKEAWARVRANAKCVYSEDYGDGFLEGFADLLYHGGSGEPPPLPPAKYRALRFQTPQGYQAVEDWFAGFRHGAREARESGQREWVTGPSALRVPTAPLLPPPPEQAILPLPRLVPPLQEPTTIPAPRVLPQPTPAPDNRTKEERELDPWLKIATRPDGGEKREAASGPSSLPGPTPPASPVRPELPPPASPVSQEPTPPVSPVSQESPKVPGSELLEPPPAVVLPSPRVPPAWEPTEPPAVHVSPPTAPLPSPEPPSAAASNVLPPTEPARLPPPAAPLPSPEPPSVAVSKVLPPTEPARLPPPEVLPPQEPEAADWQPTPDPIPRPQPPPKPQPKVVPASKPAEPPAPRVLPPTADPLSQPPPPMPQPKMLPLRDPEASLPSAVAPVPEPAKMPIPKPVVPPPVALLPPPEPARSTPPAVVPARQPVASPPRVSIRDVVATPGVRPASQSVTPAADKQTPEHREVDVVPIIAVKSGGSGQPERPTSASSGPSLTLPAMHPVLEPAKLPTPDVRPAPQYVAPAADTEAQDQNQVNAWRITSTTPVSGGQREGVTGSASLRTLTPPTSLPAQEPAKAPAPAADKEAQNPHEANAWRIIATPPDGGAGPTGASSAPIPAAIRLPQQPALEPPPLDDKAGK